MNRASQAAKARQGHVELRVQRVTMAHRAIRAMTGCSANSYVSNLCSDTMIIHVYTYISVDFIHVLYRSIGCTVEMVMKIIRLPKYFVISLTKEKRYDEQHIILLENFV